MNRLWVAGFLLLLAGCSNASATDPALVGTWESEAMLEGRKWTFVFDIKEGGFTFTSTTRDGTFVAKNGQWRVFSQKGFSDGGAYSFPSTDSMSMSGKYGTAILKRIGPGDTSRGARVDASVVGIWGTKVPIDGKEHSLRYTFAGHGDYELQLVTEDGDYEAKDGKWKSVSKSGHEEEGQYVFVDENSVSISGPKGTAQWRRLDPSNPVIAVGDRFGELVQKIHENAVRASSKSWMFGGDIEKYREIKGVKSKGSTHLIVSEYHEECYDPKLGNRCSSRTKETNDSPLDLTKVRLTSIEVHNVTRSMRTDSPYEIEGRGVHFKCGEGNVCWGVKGDSGWILCRDKKSCVTLAKDFKALVRLVQKQTGSSLVARVKDKPKKNQYFGKCGALATKKVPTILRDVQFRSIKYPTPWRYPKNAIRFEFKKGMDENEFCGKGLVIIYGRDVSAEIQYAIFNTTAAAKKRDKIVREKQYDSRLLGEYFKGVTVMPVTLSDDKKKVVAVCQRPKFPDPNQLFRVTCIDLDPFSPVQVIVKGDFTAGIDPNTAIRAMDDLLFLAVKYFAQAMLRADGMTFENNN